MKHPYLVWQCGFHESTGTIIQANDIHEAVNQWAAEFDGMAPAHCRLPIVWGNKIKVYAALIDGVEPETPLTELAANAKLFVATGEMLPVYRAKLVVNQ